MSTELAKVEVLPPATQGHQLVAMLRPEDIEARFRAIEVLKAKHMRKGIDADYGVIPGCKKPTLLKPGAEKLGLLFQIGSGEPVVEDLGNGLTGTTRIVHYRVRLPIVSLQSGQVLGWGVGECSSEEDKYKWRKIECREEFDAALECDRRVKWRTGQNGAYSLNQVRIDPTTIANTILKMAKKRALVDGTLNVTGASSIFTQDAEDLPQGVAGDAAAATNGEAPVRPQRKSESAPTAPMDDAAKQRELEELCIAIATANKAAVVGEDGKWILALTSDSRPPVDRAKDLCIRISSFTAKDGAIVSGKPASELTAKRLDVTLGTARRLKGTL